MDELEFKARAILGNYPHESYQKVQDLALELLEALVAARGNGNNGGIGMASTGNGGGTG